MTLEQGAIFALSAVTGALCFLFNMLRTRSDECERDRRELRDEIEIVKERLGLAHGELKGVRRCPRDGCPFRSDDDCGTTLDTPQRA